MHFYYNDYIYEQRTDHSKIFCYNDNNKLIEKYEDFHDLPNDVYYEYLNVLQMVNNPENFFSVEKITEDECKIKDFNGTIQNLIIPEKINDKYIVDIESSSYLINLRYLEIPAHFKNCPTFLLSNSRRLKNVYLHDGATYEFVEYAFAMKKELISIHIPNNMTKISNGCFYECYSLKDINLENIKEIGNTAFEKCKSLKSCTLPDGLHTIGIKAFHKSGIESINIPKTVTEIKQSAFKNCNDLKQVTNFSDVKLDIFSKNEDISL